MQKVFYDYCGWYRIVVHRNGTTTLYHTLASTYDRVKVSDHKSYEAAKRALARYCGGMPKPIIKNNKPSGSG